MTEKITRGSGNVFADLGFENPEEMETKAKLVSQINAIIKKRKLTQKQAGVILGITQSRVSDLARGGLSGFSVDRLLRLLNKLDREVEIVVKPKSSRRPATTRVVFADPISV
ncbi:MAG: helix-turn-helix domain-containing protein [Nitrospirales bacterium]|nr:XRE family transcriptional regulator [Nitrospira sp.]MDR4500851.1 helix-turn-helix domain-containing protein [Nitrospirales bacterium]